MKIKPKGRKIYRRKDRFEHLKHVRHSIIMTLLIAGALVFVGYSAGAPVLNFLQERNFLAPPSYYTTETVTAEHTEPEPQMTETIEISEAETQPETKLTETEPSTEAKSQIGFLQKAPKIQGCMLDTSALMSETALQNALYDVPEEMTHVIVPLKVQGGEIYYATSVKDAARSSAVQAFIPLKEIYAIISENGYEPVAMINLLEDTLFAKTYPDASYLFPESGELWTDKSTEEDAFWLAPFSGLTQEYLADIAEEVEISGFEILICGGLQYPNFPRTDLHDLDSMCSEENRYEYLTELLTEMRRKAPEIAFFVRIDGEGALDGDLETLYAAEQLPADCLLITMNAQTRKNYDQLTELSDAVPVMFEWQGSDIPKNAKFSYILNQE